MGAETHSDDQKLPVMYQIFCAVQPQTHHRPYCVIDSFQPVRSALCRIRTLKPVLYLLIPSNLHCIVLKMQNILDILQDMVYNRSMKGGDDMP